MTAPRFELSGIFIIFVRASRIDMSAGKAFSRHGGRPCACMIATTSSIA